MPACKMQMAAPGDEPQGFSAGLGLSSWRKGLSWVTAGGLRAATKAHAAQGLLSRGSGDAARPRPWVLALAKQEQEWVRLGGSRGKLPCFAQDGAGPCGPGEACSAMHFSSTDIALSSVPNPAASGHRHNHHALF